MKILILDSRNLYSNSIIKNTRETWYVDLVTEKSFSQLSSNINVNIIYGSRREPKTYKTLLNTYDIIIDADSLVVEDIEFVMSSVKTDRYILFSTAQVYRFIGKEIYCENCIDEKYIREINQEYIDYEKSPEKFYVREKINIENKVKEICKKEGITYNILRIAKYYSEDDYYKDITWILTHLKCDKTIVLHEENLIKMGSYNPIFQRDFINVLKNIIEDIRKESFIINIAQDSPISLLSLIRIVSKELMDEEMYHIICIPHESRDYYGTVTVPCNESLFIDNSKLKELYDVKFTNTENWVKELGIGILKKVKKCSKTTEEKNISNCYKKYSIALNEECKNRNEQLKNKSLKGKVVKFYEKK